MSPQGPYCSIKRSCAEEPSANTRCAASPSFLTAEGFVRRTRSTLDERTVEVTLTEKGRALKQKAAEIPAQAGAYMDLSPEDAAQLYRILYGILKREDRGRKSE